MAKIIRFISLEMENFTAHHRLSLEYGDVTKLSGRNGQGKTSIGTAPAWVLWGVDLFGRKWSPKPVNYDANVTRAALILEVDGTAIKFERGIDGGDNMFLINDVPTKAKEYESTVAGLFDRDEFLSLYNPQYFFGLHWTKQREMILRYTTPPAKSEVLKQLPSPQADKLADLTKKHSLDDLQKIHGGTGGQKSKLEKAHIAAQSRTKTLQEQIDRLPPLNGGSPIDPETTKRDIGIIDAKIEEAIASMSGADENNRKIIALQSKVASLRDKRDRMKEQFAALQAEPIADTCRVCRQPLQGESVTAAEADKQRRIADFKREYDAVVVQRKEAEAELAALEYIDVSETMAAVRKLQEDRQYLVDLLQESERRQQLAEFLEDARIEEAATHASLKESIFILDSAKAYRAKEAELQAAKVQALFTTLSIRLFKYVKSTDEWEPDFSIQMDGKDYAVLSAGEKIAAGLELAEVLFKQSELVVPCFIDGIESYTGRVAVYDQLVTGRAVLDQELKIETEEAA
ncbi:ATPase [Cohnella lubricantis]|uniref:Nuclease SbcCD subunit C n=1 Tax=Cohnella lubricantis TaxID=2163172 RepID=A0A841TA95_9BACL|nr:ATPase [Cohnella lubricantis]MBB6675957.1 ATPase [Cohnella lubricantis]MBP2117926.1 DNA repair exonuclease SbcCD ATPase subunit [Cohnella lubricantis]